MIYLRNTTARQRVLIPKTEGNNGETDFGLLLVSTFGGRGAELDVKDVADYANYYAFDVELPAGLEVGEYTYTVRGRFSGTTGVAVITEPRTYFVENKNVLIYEQYNN